MALVMDKLGNSAQYMDLAALDNLRARAQQDGQATLKEVAQQFEGIFVQMLMQSMRDANEAFKSDSPFNSQYTRFYEQMRDQQMSVELGAQGTLGLADLMVQQLSPQTSGVMPASVLRGNMPGFKTTDNDALPPGLIMPSVQETASDAAAQPAASPWLGNALAQADLMHKQVPSENSHKPPHGNPLPPRQVVEHQGFNTPDEFIEQLYPLADKAARQLGTQAEVLLAQAALETGWGQKMVRRADGQPSNNLFNIKADQRWGGDSARVSTLEYEQGVAVRQQADFRVYESLASSFDDFVSFISNSDRYAQAREAAADPRAFMQGLQQAGYATDPSYADKVLRVMGAVAGKLATSVAGE